LQYELKSIKFSIKDSVSLRLSVERLANFLSYSIYFVLNKTLFNCFRTTVPRVGRKPPMKTSTYKSMFDRDFTLLIVKLKNLGLNYLVSVRAEAVELVEVRKVL
jgi:hypothetical protein